MELGLRKHFLSTQVADRETQTGKGVGSGAERGSQRERWGAKGLTDIW